MDRKRTHVGPSIAGKLDQLHPHKNTKGEVWVSTKDHGLVPISIGTEHVTSGYVDQCPVEIDIGGTWLLVFNER